MNSGIATISRMQTPIELPPAAIVNVEAEATLLGAMMMDPLLIDRIADRVKPDDFSIALHNRLFEVIVREAALGRGTSPVAIKGYFDGDPQLEQLGGPAYLARLTGNPVAMVSDVRDLARQITDLADRRRMRSGLIEAVEACADLGTSLPEISTLADAAVAARAESSVVEADAAECVDAWLAELDADVTGVSCHIIPNVDELLGQLRPKSLNIVAGRPGMGKTAFACSYARGAASRGHGTLFVSLEMSKEDLIGRMISDSLFDHESCRIPYSVLQRRRLNSWERERVAEAGSLLSRIPLTVVDAGTLAIGRLQTLVRRHKRRMAARGHPLDLVIVDYLQLLHPDTKMKDAYQATSEVSKRLKAIAKDEDVAIMALAQLSRSVEQRQDKRPQLSDLRDSGQIEQDADVVLFLLREEYYLAQTEPQNDPEAHERWEDRMERIRGVLEFILAKRRNGTTGIARGRFFAPYQAVR
ncbi:DnaB-like helicase C-terminal domain-containing protein [Novosphingobium sp.]|uniref:replicative DNA helicase n=1 Tax=Novosphingobium sp. TaxID=1874826 RepID=UPI0026385CC5|nr:DnaB-like helicase C-terminal domain-containing protein [Novosphingobium sp.]